MRTLLLFFFAASTCCASAQIAIRAETMYTMAGPALKPGIIIIAADGTITAVGGPSTPIPDGHTILEAKVAVPGLIDCRGTVGVSGLFNSPADSDQLERSSPIQPELRAIDAFNPRDDLVAWVRSLGVTTVNTGHAPGELISGQLAAIKTTGESVEKSVLKDVTAIAATLGPWAQKGGTSPGTRAKMVAMLRDQLIKAQEYRRGLASPAPAPTAPVASPASAPANAPDLPGTPDGSPPASPSLPVSPSLPPPTPPARDLRLEMLVRVLDGEVPLLVTANRAQDIAGVLRLRAEFDIPIILDSAAEAYLMLDEIKAAKIPVFIHPTMFRMFGEMENMSVETASKLRAADVPFAIQSGYEAYVPKTRIVLFEAAIAAANGLTFDQALAAITIDAARILKLDDRIGSLEPGKDGDVAMFDGDPFEYTTHCTGTVINGVHFADGPR